MRSNGTCRYVDVVFRSSLASQKQCSPPYFTFDNSSKVLILGPPAPILGTLTTLFFGGLTNGRNLLSTGLSVGFRKPRSRSDQKSNLKLGSIVVRLAESKGEHCIHMLLLLCASSNSTVYLSVELNPYMDLASIFTVSCSQLTYFYMVCLIDYLVHCCLLLGLGEFDLLSLKSL